VDLRGASALVTGAGRGIGRAITLTLARAGARVTAVSRTRAELDAVVDSVRAGGGAALAYAADLREPGGGAACVDAAVRAHGRLQVLVNNAGIGAWASLAETTDETWEDVLGTNLTAVFRITRAALPHLVQGGGHVFMISSLAGSNPIAGMSAYCASKAALDHLAACLMLEVRQRGVKVTVIAPGSVATGFGGEPRDEGWMLRPEDVAAAVLDLVRARDDAHLSRVEMRPLRPRKP
jgi:NAD(P)-dependent dehydrogenase (short-subunit alcohol dehydrogenase family)